MSPFWFVDVLVSPFWSVAVFADDQKMAIPHKVQKQLLLVNYICITMFCIYKKLSYCWETVRRESMPRIAEMDVEMTV